LTFGVAEEALKSQRRDHKNVLKHRFDLEVAKVHYYNSTVIPCFRFVIAAKRIAVELDRGEIAAELGCCGARFGGKRMPRMGAGIAIWSEVSGFRPTDRNA
jgi:hypothetical protein